MLKHFLIIISLLSTLALRVTAQHAVGSWEVYSNYGIDRGDIIDTNSKVYFCGGGSLFHYDKDIDETYSYNIGNGLSDVNVKALYRNYDRDYIVVVYDNSNMDVVYDNGRIVNLSEVKDAQYVNDRTINWIDFDGDNMYVACSFGMVKYDLRNASVTESGMFGFPVNGVTVHQGHVMIGTDKGLYAISVDDRINDFNRFTRMSDVVCTQLMSATDKMIFIWEPTNNRAVAYSVDFETSTITNRWSWVFYGTVKLRRFGEYAALTNGGIFFVWGVNEQGSIVFKDVKLPASLYTTGIYMSGNTDGNANDIWYINDDGLGHLTYPTPYLQITDANNFTIDREPSYPMGTTIHGGPTRLAASPIGIYATYGAQSRYPAIDNYNMLMKLNLIENGFVKDITPKAGDYTLTNGNSGNMLRTGHHIVIDPIDPSIIYVPSWFEGVWKFKDGKQIGKYDHTNSDIPQPWASSVEDVSIDNNGNLWIIRQDFTDKSEKILFLSGEKNKNNICEEKDWIKLNLPNFGTVSSRDSKIVHFKHSKNKNLAIITQTFGDQNVIIYDTNGTSAVSDDKYWMLNQFTDQDGKTFGPYAVVSIAEDHNGDIWLGTACGVIVIHNLRSMLANRDNSVERVKVPRNDGTSLADYLLDNQSITSIAVDAGNNKWLGTTASGVYYVSSDGREILENFTRDNSMIPSDVVQSVVCDPNSSDVYFGTTNGLAVYHSTVAPAADDFSEVYAYPNPVRPDYSGWITIKGLMDNSLVKIADSAGNVFLQTRSEGGMVIWDGCNAAGERVPTGVYYVYASQNQDNNSNGAVTKILVVK